jgi:hypothetical protein
MTPSPRARAALLALALCVVAVLGGVSWQAERWLQQPISVPIHPLPSGDRAAGAGPAALRLAYCAPWGIRSRTGRRRVT